MQRGHGFAGIAAGIPVQVRSGGDASGAVRACYGRDATKEKAEDLSPTLGIRWMLPTSLCFVVLDRRPNSVDDDSMAFDIEPFVKNLYGPLFGPHVLIEVPILKL